MSSGAASFIINTGPVFVAVLSSLFLNERFSRWAWAGTAMSLVGAALIAAHQPGGLQFGAGAAWVLLAAVCQATFFVLQRPLAKTLGPLRTTTWVVTLGALWLSPWLWQALQQALHASPTGLAALLYLAVFPGALGFFTWTRAQAHFGAARAANFLYLVPPLALTLAYQIHGELPSLMTLVGGTLAVLGVLVVNTLGR